MKWETQVLIRKATRAAGGGVYPLSDDPDKQHGIACIPVAAPGWCTIALMEKDEQHFQSQEIQDVVEYVSLVEGYDSRRALWRILSRVGVEIDVCVVATSMMRVRSEDDLKEGRVGMGSVRMRDCKKTILYAYDDTVVFARGGIERVKAGVGKILQKELAVPAKLYREEIAPPEVKASEEEMVDELEKNLRWHMRSERRRKVQQVLPHPFSGERAYRKAIMSWDPIGELKKRYGT